MVIDVVQCARAGRVFDGAARVTDFTRLCQGLPQPQAGGLTWVVRVYEGRGGQVRLDVRCDAELQVVCQRCLEPFTLHQQVQRTLGPVVDDAELDAMEAQQAHGQDADVEFLVAPARLDLRELVEDELILAVPYAPMHETCPAIRKPQPFAGARVPS